MGHRSMKRLTAILVLVLFIISGCATGPKFPTDQVLTRVTPAMVVQNNAAYIGKRVIWGGMIVNSTNLKAATRLEILGFPLTRAQRPTTSGRPQRRFLADHKGYLETVNYTKGRYVTVIGTISRNQPGRVGESKYEYPLIHIDRIYLWPVETPGTSRPRFHIGIGVIFGR